jgi:hypothetical protein
VNGRRLLLMEVLEIGLKPIGRLELFMVLMLNSFYNERNDENE